MGSGIEFVGMEVIVLVFRESPAFRTLVTRIRSTLGWDERGLIVGMDGRYDAGLGSKTHVLLMPILCNDDWDTYKEIVLASEVRLLEVVVERTIVDDDMGKNIDVVNGTMEEVESTVELSQDPPMEEQLASVLTTMRPPPPVVDLSYMSVSISHHLSDPVTDFNGVVLNNELDEEVFRDGTVRDVELDEG